MEFSVILNWILGGGLLAAVIGITTLKATVLKAKSEAERAKADADKAKAEAETVRIDNADTTPIQRQISCNIQNDKKLRVNANMYSI